MPNIEPREFIPTCVICKETTTKVMMDHPDGDGIEECWYRGYPDKGMWIELRAEEGQEGVDNLFNHLTIGTPPPPLRFPRGLEKVLEELVPNKERIYTPPLASYIGGPFTMMEYNGATKEWECHHDALCFKCFRRAYEEKYKDEIPKGMHIGPFPHEEEN